MSAEYLLMRESIFQSAKDLYRSNILFVCHVNSIIILKQTDEFSRYQSHPVFLHANTVLKYRSVDGLLFIDKYRYPHKDLVAHLHKILGIRFYIQHGWLIPENDTDKILLRLKFGV